MIFRGDVTHDRMTVTKLAPPAYAFDSRHTATLWNEDLGFAEPIVDRMRWRQDQVLTMLLQQNLQPDGDRAHEMRTAPVTLADFEIN